MKLLFILRACPGAGKTKLAGSLLAMHGGGRMFAADDYFVQPDGSYVFDRGALHQAHAQCRKNTEQALRDGVEVVVVHNTNTTEKEIAPYLRMGEEYGYTTFSLIVENRHGNSNIHGVPEETLFAMEKRFQVRLLGD